MPKCGLDKTLQKFLKVNICCGQNFFMKSCQIKLAEIVPVIFDNGRFLAYLTPVSTCIPEKIK